MQDALGAAFQQKASTSGPCFCGRPQAQHSVFRSHNIDNLFLVSHPAPCASLHNAIGDLGTSATRLAAFKLPDAAVVMEAPEGAVITDLGYDKGIYTKYKFGQELGKGEHDQPCIAI